MNTSSSSPPNEMFTLKNQTEKLFFYFKKYKTRGHVSLKWFRRTCVQEGFKKRVDIHIMRELYITRRAILSGCCCYVSTCQSSFVVVVYGKVEQLSDRWQRWNVACRWTRDFPIPLSPCRLVFGSGGSFVHQMETKSKGECVWYRSQTHITHSTRVGYFRLKRRGAQYQGRPHFSSCFSSLSLSLSLFLSYFFVPERERRERTLFLERLKY